LTCLGKGIAAGMLENVALSASVAGNALTIALKTVGGANPSHADPGRIGFRSVNAVDGDCEVLRAVAATSIVVSSGSTLGASTSAFRVWVVAFNDAGTLRLGVINCRAALSIHPLAAWGIASSTAEGGAGAADSAQVFYTGAAVASKPYTVLGYVSYEAGLAVAGTYAAAPTRAQVFGPGVPLPNTRVQNVHAESGGSSTTSTSYVDVTNATLSITPSSAANAVRVQASAWVQAPNVASFNTGVLTQLTDGANAVLDDVANFGHASPSGAGGTGHEGRTFFQKWHLPNTGAAVTYKLRHRASGGGGTENVTTQQCQLHAEEVMV
ncbi:MAG: hypothetical protein ACT4PS_04455, partial [Betaproteobacteria bacterium]